MAALPASFAAPASSDEDGQPSGSLARLAALAARLDGSLGDELSALADEIAREFESERQRAEDLGVAQAEALVNSAMIMSDLEASQTALEHAREVAEAASRAKSDFLANMSHEIRTPINGVLGMNEILMRTELSPKQQRCVATIRNSVEALLRVINDILDFSKIESGKLELHDAPFDLRCLLEELVELYADNAQQHGVELNAVIPVSMATQLVGDDGRLRQILTNLVGNALKFTPAGEVVVTVAVERELADGGLVLRFEVRDTGIGIAPEARAHIFEAFTQADGSTQRRYGGTGLGLTISSQLVRCMGGEISVASELDKGSTFTFTVALERDPFDYSKDEAHDALRGLRVLAVDDNETNRAIYRDQLGHWGCDFDIACDGANALERLARAAQPFELVILDMHMPGMDGMELARHISADDSLGRPALIMLSSISDQLGADNYKQHGIAQYLTKPVRHLDLYRCLRRLRQGELGNASVAVSTPAATPPLRGRVLVAEDNLVNQEVIRDLLDFDGLHLMLVGDGRQALDALSAEHFDLVLMDCQMPVMDGFAATESLRARERAAGAEPVPVVALTANALEGDRERCLAAGMSDYLAKPFTAEQLYALLARWMRAECVTPAASASAPTASSETRPLLAPAALAHFEARERAGRVGVLGRVLGAFITQSRVLIAQMSDGLAAQDCAALCAAAHALKSSSAVIGAEALSALCRETEEACRAGECARAASVAPQAVAMFEAVEQALRERYPAHCP